jgi:hypothetical protein
MGRFLDALFRDDIDQLIKPDEDTLSERAALQIGSETVNIALVRERNSPVRRLEILGGSNDLQEVARAYEYMQEHGRETTWTGGPFVATPRAQYDEQLLRASELRAAFLVAFAAFGYRYAFNPRLALVRQQIRTPLTQVIDGWSVAINQTWDGWHLVLLTEPIPAVLVKLGRSDVLLPWLSSPLNFYDALATIYRPNGPLRVSGEEVEWPTTLVMVLDSQ